LGQDAARVVRERFGWDGVAKRFAEICEATLRKNFVSTDLWLGSQCHQTTD